MDDAWGPLRPAPVRYDDDDGAPNVDENPLEGVLVTGLPGVDGRPPPRLALDGRRLDPLSMLAERGLEAVELCCDRAKDGLDELAGGGTLVRSSADESNPRDAALDDAGFPAVRLRLLLVALLFPPRPQM